MKRIFLSIVIPAYNEEARLPAYLFKILGYLRTQYFSYEIIVVDDGSVDSTPGIVEKLAADYHHLKLIRLPSNRGKGFAVKTGMLHASGVLRLFTDADGSTPISQLERLRKALDSGADVAIGSRAMDDGKTVVRAHLHRKVMGSIFNMLVKALAVRGISDTQCGFKLFTAASANKVFSLQRIDDFGFDAEILFISRKNRYRICEVPVDWTDTVGSKVRLGRDSFKMFVGLLKVRLNNFAGHYNVGYNTAEREEKSEVYEI